MGTELKRLTFVIPPDMELMLDGMKKEIFYNCSQSEMIRTLLTAGLDSLKTGQSSSESDTERTA